MGKNKGNKSFMVNVAIILFAQIMVKLLGLIYRMVLTNIRGFGDSGNGYLSAGFQIYTLLLAISSIGIPNAVAKTVSEKAAVGDYRGAHRVFTSSLVLFAVIGAVFSILLYFGANVVSDKILNMAGAQYVMRALAPSIFFVCVSSVVRGYFQGLNDMSATSWSQMLEQVFKCSITITLVLLTVGTMPGAMQLLTKATFLYKGPLEGKTPPEIMAAWANAATSISTLLSFVYLIFFYIKRRSGIVEEMRRSAVSDVKESSGKIMLSILMLSIPISLASVITAINRVIDTATITRGIEVAFAGGIPASGNLPAISNPTLKQLNDEAVRLAGMLSKSDTLINMPLALNVAFATVLVPSIAGELAVGKKESAARKMTYSFLISILMILPCCFGYIFLAQPIYNVIYPKAPIGSSLLALTSISLIFSALSQTMSGSLQGIGKVFVPAVGLLAGCVVKILLNLILIRIPSVNIYGAAISTIVCQIVAFIISFAVLSKYVSLKMTFSKYVLKPLISCLVMGVVALVAYYGAKFGFGHIAGAYVTEVLATVIAIALAAVVYVIMISRLKILDKNEIEMLPKGQKVYAFLEKHHIY